MSLLYDDIYDDLAKLETRQPSYATIQTIVCLLKLSVRLYLMWFTHISGFRFGNKASIPYVCVMSPYWNSCFFDHPITQVLDEVAA